jgi:uncharacterized membrane protein
MLNWLAESGDWVVALAACVTGLLLTLIFAVIMNWVDARREQERIDNNYLIRNRDEGDI